MYQRTQLTNGRCKRSRDLVTTGQEIWFQTVVAKTLLPVQDIDDTGHTIGNQCTSTTRELYTHDVDSLT